MSDTQLDAYSLSCIDTKDILCINEVKGRLGHGLFGKVTLGFYKKNQVIAAKCSRFYGSPTQMERLEKEVKNLQQARHKHIVNVIGWAEWEIGVAIIMEYMPGGNIWDLLSDPIEIPISPLLQLCFCVDISCGIAHIHDLLPKAKMVHGDIKPENILLTERLLCKIADFGGSTLAARSESSVSSPLYIPSSDEKHLTPIYSAPEVLKSPLMKSRSTHDVYSFGIVVYEILTRSKPNQHHSRENYIESIKDEQRPDESLIEDLLEELSETDAEIIAFLQENIMQKCWSHKPSNRPKMADVYKDLKNLLSQFSADDQEEAARKALAKKKINLPSLEESETVTIDKIPLPDLNPAMSKNVETPQLSKHEYQAESKQPTSYFRSLEAFQQKVNTELENLSRALCTPLPKDVKRLEEKLKTQQKICNNIKLLKSDCETLKQQQPHTSSTFSSMRNFTILAQFTDLLKLCENAELMSKIQLEKIKCFLTMSTKIKSLSIKLDAVQKLLDKHENDKLSAKDSLEIDEILKSNSIIEDTFQGLFSNLSSVRQKLQQLRFDKPITYSDFEDWEETIEKNQTRWKTLKESLQNLQHVIEFDGSDDVDLFLLKTKAFRNDLKEFKAFSALDGSLSMNIDEVQEMIKQHEVIKNEIDQNWKERWTEIESDYETLSEINTKHTCSTLQTDYRELEKEWEKVVQNVPKRLSQLEQVKNYLNVYISEKTNFSNFNDEATTVKKTVHQALIDSSPKASSVDEILSKIEKLLEDLKIVKKKSISLLESSFHGCKQVLDINCVKELTFLTKQMIEMKKDWNSLFHDVNTLSQPLLEISGTMKSEEIQQGIDQATSDLQKYEEELRSITGEIESGMDLHLPVDSHRILQLEEQKIKIDSKLQDLKAQAARLYSECKQYDSSDERKNNLLEKLKLFENDLKRALSMHENVALWIQLVLEAATSFDRVNEIIQECMKTLLGQCRIADGYESLKFQEQDLQNLKKNVLINDPKFQSLMDHCIKVKDTQESICVTHDLEVEQNLLIAADDVMTVWKDVKGQLDMRLPLVQMAQKILQLMETNLKEVQEILHETACESDLEKEGMDEYISRAERLSAVQAQIEKHQLTKQKLQEEKAKTAKNFSDFKENSKRFQEIVDTFLTNYLSYANENVETAKKIKSDTSDPSSAAISLLEQLTNAEESISDSLESLERSIEKYEAYKRKPRLSLHRNSPTMKEIKIEDLVCINGESGLLSEGKSGFVRAGFYKTYTPVAIKYSGFDPSTKHETASRISNEIEHFQHISHDTIVRVLGYFEKDEGEVGLIMEYLCGGNLLQVVENENVKLHPLLCLRMSIDIADGLMYLHSLPPRGLVHGNLKTENILLSDSLRCKIAGLGMANLLVDDSKISTVSECIYDEDEVSMIFVDPELLNERSKKQALCQDVYSFSIVMYELLLRKRPFKQPKDRRSYRNMVLKGDRPIITGIIEKIKEYCQSERFLGEVKILETMTEVMLQCWSKDSSERPSMTEAKAQLVDLRYKFKDTDLLNDAAIAAKTLNGKHLIRSKHNLVPIKAFVKPRTGFPSNESDSQSEAIYDDLVEKESSITVPPPLPRRNPIHTELDDDAFIGFNHEKVFIYNVKHRISSDYPPFHVLHERGSMVMMHRTCYVIGGTNPIVEKIKVDAHSAEWLVESHLQATRIHASSAVLNGKMYVTGGSKIHNGDSIASSEMYEEQTGEWREAEYMKEPRRNHGLVAMIGKLYAAGGFLSRTAESVDPREGIWRSIPSMQSNRYALATVALDDKLYAIGGWDGNDTLSSVERFNPIAQKWENVAKLNVNRCLHGAAVLHGNIYVGGGRITENVFTGTVEIYDPKIDRWEIEGNIAAVEGAMCFAS